MLLICCWKNSGGSWKKNLPVVLEAFYYLRHPPIFPAPEIDPDLSIFPAPGTVPFLSCFDRDCDLDREVCFGRGIDYC